MTIEKIKESLEKKYPEYEYIVYGEIGNKGLIIKKSVFIGARVFYGMERIFVKRTPPIMIGNLVDYILFRIISGIMKKKLYQI